MTISTINQVKPIVLHLNSSSTADIYPIFTDEPFTIENGTIISENIFVKNLKAFAKITSLDEAVLPDITLEDSQQQATIKAINAEFSSPRKQLDLLISAGNNQWFPVGSISLLNPSGYPYRVHNLMDLYTDNLAIELGKEGMLGVRLKEVGTGLLTGNDEITIHGSYVKEIVIDDSPPSITNSIPFNTTVTNQSSIILEPNPNRKYAIICNDSDNDIYLNLGTIAMQGKGIVIKPNGNFDYSIKDISYKGVITAISNTNALISGIEST
jgi:hypothetical protein